MLLYVVGRNTNIIIIPRSMMVCIGLRVNRSDYIVERTDSVMEQTDYFVERSIN